MNPYKAPIEIADYNYPKNSEENRNEIVVAVLGTNDVHGGAYERNLEYENYKFEKGGFKYFSGVLDIIREEFDGNSLWLDAGDQFSGTYENIVTEGKIIKDFYNVMKVDAATLGNHEWDRGESWLRENMKNELGRYLPKEIVEKAQTNSFLQKIKENKINNEIFNIKKSQIIESDDGINSDNKSLYLAANLAPKGNTQDLPNKSSSKIFTMKSGIKIGVIGLTTLETLYNNAHPPKNFEVNDYYETTIKEANELRKKGVDAIILLTHIGTHCKGETPNELMELKLRDENYLKGSTFCDDELGELVVKLTNNEVDLVIGGEGVEAHHFINGIPVLQNPMTIVSANIAYLKFKKNSENKFQLIKKFIEGPVPLCSKIFTFNKRCDFVPTEKGLEMVDYTFHGKKITPNKDVNKIFENPADKIIKDAKANFIFTSDVRLERGNQKDNLLGALLCDMTKRLTKSDICVINYSALRTFWELGRISEYDIMNMFPFGGEIVKYSIKGKELKFMIKTLQEGKKAFYSTAGLKMKILENCQKKRNLIDVVFDNNEQIHDEKIYSVSGFDFFLVKGAADMTKVLKSGKDKFELPKLIENYGDLRSKLIESFKLVKHIFGKDIKYNSIELIQDKC